MLLPGYICNRSPMCTDCYQNHPETQKMAVLRGHLPSKAVSRAGSWRSVKWQERIPAPAMPQQGKPPAPHSPALPCHGLHQQAHGWVWPRPIPGEVACARGWGCPGVPRLPHSWLGWWDGLWLLGPAPMDAHGGPQPQGVFGPSAPRQRQPEFPEGLLPFVLSFVA